MLYSLKDMWRLFCDKWLTGLRTGCHLIDEWDNSITKTAHDKMQLVIQWIPYKFMKEQFGVIQYV